MLEQNTKTIPLSTGKQVMISLACLGLVAASIWMLTLDYPGSPGIGRSMALFWVYAVSVLGLLIFGALSVFNLGRLLDRRPGIVLNEAGLRDNSTGLSVGFIPWSEITGVDTHRTFNRKTFVVRVSDPQKYLAGGNALVRYLRKSNLRVCGSPVTVTTAVLNIGYDDLMAEIRDYLRRFGHVT